LLANLSGRERRSLNGAWNIIVDEHDMGAKGLFGGAFCDVPVPGTGMELIDHSFESRRQLQVPEDSNTQDERLFRYRNVVWRQRSFDLAPEQGRRYSVHFDGANYTANVQLVSVPETFIHQCHVFLGDLESRLSPRYQHA
jgi:beta-glucuronidase